MKRAVLTADNTRTGQNQRETDDGQQDEHNASPDAFFDPVAHSFSEEDPKNGAVTAVPHSGQKLGLDWLLD